MGQNWKEFYAYFPNGLEAFIIKASASRALERFYRYKRFLP
jgi:hypothetical protein